MVPTHSIGNSGLILYKNECNLLKSELNNCRLVEILIFVKPFYFHGRRDGIYLRYWVLISLWYWNQGWA